MYDIQNIERLVSYYKDETFSIVLTFQHKKDVLY